MTTRTDVATVKLIIATTLSDDQIGAFINAANLLVTERCDNQDLSAGLLATIETWLAAHLLASRDQRLDGKTIGDVRFDYSGQTGLGLDSTFYGQNVKLLDTSGRLASAGRQQAAISFFTEADE